jgi:hypothetical protein
MMRAFVVFALAASSSAMAQTFPFAGVLETSDGPVDGLVSVELSIVDAEGASLWTETQPAVVVVDGVFAVDVGAVAALPASVPASSLLALTIDDDALPPIPLARLLRATGAGNAERATTAATANTVGGATAATAATRTALAAAGGPAVDFSNISGVPAAVRDGDQGTDVTGTSADLSVSARTLNLATVSGTRVAAGAITGSSVVAGSSQVANSAITGAKVVDRGLSRASLVEDVTAREVKTVSIFIQDHAACGSGLTTSSACTPSSCGAGKQVECDGTGCSTPSGFGLRQCLNLTKVGELVVEQ